MHDQKKHKFSSIFKYVGGVITMKTLRRKDVSLNLLGVFIHENQRTTDTDLLSTYASETGQTSQ